MKLGARTFDDNVQQAANLDVDYFEAAIRPAYYMDGKIVPEVCADVYGPIKDKVVGIHGAILSHEVNFMNRQRDTQNRRALEAALKAADSFPSCRYIVFHPGYIEANDSDNCGLENLFGLMKEYDDSRIFLEFVPVFAYAERHVFPVHHVDSWKTLQDKTGKGMVLDLGHAAITARAMKYNALDYIRGLVEALGVRIVHVADNDDSGDGYEDSHLHIGKGNVPIEEVLAQNKGIELATLEVSEVSPEDVALVRSWVG